MVPQIPRQIEDVFIPAEWRLTQANKNFLIHQNNQLGLIIFGTERNLRKMQECRTAYIDGTFKSCPKPYYQFVTVHGMHSGKVLPFGMALTAGKDEEYYIELLTVLQEKIVEYSGKYFTPEAVVCDFELAIQNAVSHLLPTSQVQSCHFHFCQSLWRKISNLRLTRLYKRQRKLRKCLRMVMAIGHLSLQVVRTNFDLLAGNIFNIFIILVFLKCCVKFLIYSYAINFCRPTKNTENISALSRARRIF